MYFVLSVSCAILDHSRSEVSDAPRIEGAHGKLAQLHRRVLTLGDRKQTRATPFYAVELSTDPAPVSSQCNLRSMSVGRSIQGERSVDPMGPATGCRLLLP